MTLATFESEHENLDGLYVVTSPDRFGLMATGKKSSLVETSAGVRALYTEEATEVWFSDYGFSQLRDGYAQVALDPLFAETIDLSEPYHVFLQVYDDVSIYVSERANDNFTVQARDSDGNEVAADFSYRVVARRKGHTETRLEPVDTSARSRVSIPDRGQCARETRS